MLGLCCHFLDSSHKNILAENGLQLGKYRRGGYSDDQIIHVYVGNILRIANGLKIVKNFGVSHFRVSSSLLPLADQVSVDYKNHPQVVSAAKVLGNVVNDLDMRFTTHPGQFCVLSSDSDSVIEKSIQELSIHAWLFDAMGLSHSPKWSINIHGGKSDRLSRLVDTIKSLPNNIRSRLTLENDESCYNVIDLIQVYQETNTPICFDSHHHTFNDGGIPVDVAFDAACETWPRDIKPLQHISNSKHPDGNFPMRRQHSEYISCIPPCQLSGIMNDTIDLEIEAKMKNFAIAKLRSDFNVNRLQDA